MEEHISAVHCLCGLTKSRLIKIYAIIHTARLTAEVNLKPQTTPQVYEDIET